jgi:hypothetical protein
MIINVFRDKEKAKSLLKMAEQTEKALEILLKEDIIKEHQSLPVREYYEIIRSLATGLLLCTGFKAIGENAHKETIDFLLRFKEITAFEIEKMQDLRIRRNKSSYEGKPIESPYLENNREFLKKIIFKLKKILRFELLK